MVFYFTSNVVSPPMTIFMGLDKYESKYKDLFVKKVKSLVNFFLFDNF